MGVFTYESEKTSTLPPAKLYDALAKKFHILLPQLIPNVQSVEILEGNGGPGTILKVIAIEEDGKTKYGVQKVDAVDEASFTYHYSIVEGDTLPDYVEKISFEDKLVEGPNGGSIAKIVAKYHTKGDATPLDDDLIKGREKGEKIFRAIEAYLLAN